MNKNKTKILAIVLGALLLAAPLLAPKQARASAVGGRFLPGVFDIFTPSLTCGLIVSVIKTDGTIGVYTFLPATVYDYFYMTPSHIGNSMLGMSTDIPTLVCPPVLYIVGSSIAP